MHVIALYMVGGPYACRLQAIQRGIGQAQTSPEEVPAAAVDSVPPAVEPVGRLFEDAESVLDRARTSVRNAAPVIVAIDQPQRIGKLLGVAPLVVDCDEASVWSRQG